MMSCFTIETFNYHRHVVDQWWNYIRNSGAHWNSYFVTSHRIMTNLAMFLYPAPYIYRWGSRCYSLHSGIPGVQRHIPDTKKVMERYGRAVLCCAAIGIYFLFTKGTDVRNGVLVQPCTVQLHAQHASLRVSRVVGVMTIGIRLGTTSCLLFWPI